MPVSDRLRTRLQEKLGLLYGSRADGVLQSIEEVIERRGPLRAASDSGLWDERSVVLITYGDQVRADDCSALEAQRRFLLDHALDKVVSDVHLLPFFPYSSDDGFSVIDYRQVDPNVGDWPDVERMGESFGLMFDFVVNHCSQQNEWFRRYLNRESHYSEYFIDVDPATDLSAVTRPRSHPLLTPFPTADGVKHVWTTFSADQVDLNFGNPDVLLEMLDILLSYIGHGARVIRLDAIGFLWKQVGTTCMHLPETHAVVKLMRDVVDEVAPGTVLLTETNVPHAENVSYFGDGDEAHAVYQFSLPPLLLDAFLSGDAGALNAWLRDLDYPAGAMTFFNFTASHDGIGVRPLEGLVPSERIAALADRVRQLGGRVNLRRKPDGSESPYELNITYVSALNTPEGLPAEEHARKFLASQGVMLSLRGMPGIYFHSLIGTENYIEGVAQTGHNRTINRRKFDSDELRQILDDSESLQGRIFDGYRRMLAVRVEQPAFHPDAPQTIVEHEHSSLVAFERQSLDGNQSILVVVNVSDQPVSIHLDSLSTRELKRNLLGGPIERPDYEVSPYEVAWLTT